MTSRPLILGVAELNGTQWVIGVSGLPGQKIVLQSSSDLHHWQPVATNILTSGNCTYTNNVPRHIGQQFYRTLLLP